jgi:hypothetical protein
VYGFHPQIIAGIDLDDIGSLPFIDRDIQQLDS